MISEKTKHNLKTMGMALGVLFVLVAAWTSYWDSDNRKIHQLQVDDYKITIRGQISWDNYCFPHVIIIEKAQPKINNTFKLNSQPASHCGIPQPWVTIKDVNGDGHKDVQLMRRDHSNPDTRVTTDAFMTYVFQPATNSFSAE